MLKLILRDLIPVRSLSLACNCANQSFPFLEASRYSSNCLLKPCLNRPPSLMEIGGSSIKLSSNTCNKSSNGSRELNWFDATSFILSSKDLILGISEIECLSWIKSRALTLP